MEHIASQNSTPPPLSHHQTHATSQHYDSNQKSENPNPEPNSDLPVEPLNKTHDTVSGIDQGLRPLVVDTNSSAISLYHSHGGIHDSYDFSSLAYAQPEYYQDPNVANALKNWAMEVLRYYGSTPNDTCALLCPRGNSTRKKRANQIKVIQSVWCEVCRVECNTKKVLEKHKAGRKHTKNVEKLKGTIAPPPPAVNENRKVAEPAEDLETKRRKIMEEGAASDAVKVCTICNVVCNSELVFAYHNMGKKHASMAKQQRLSDAAATATAAT